MADAARSTIISAEQSLLRCLCRAGIASLSPTDLHRVQSYSWLLPDHRIICMVLVRLANAPASFVRAQIPAEATRMGFPDIEWEVYFDESGKRQPNQSATELIDELFSESQNRE